MYQYDVTVNFCSHKIISPAVVEPQTESQSKVDMNKSKQHRAAWLPEEHESFMRGLQVYGWGRWKEIARYMGNGRTNTQVKSHAQKYQEKHPHVKPGNPYRHDVPHEIRATARARAVITPNFQLTGGELAREHFNDFLGKDLNEDFSTDGSQVESPSTTDPFSLDPVEPPSEVRFNSNDTRPATLQDILDNLYAPVDWNDSNDVEVLANGGRKELKRSQLLCRRLAKLLKHDHAARGWWNGNVNNIHEYENSWHTLLQVICSEEHSAWCETGAPRSQNEIDDIKNVILLVNEIWVQICMSLIDNQGYTMDACRLQMMQGMVFRLVQYGISLSTTQNHL